MTKPTPSSHSVAIGAVSRYDSAWQNPPIDFGRVVARPGIDQLLWLQPATGDERRQCTRRALRCPVLLLESGEDDVRPRGVPGECLNAGDGGLYVVVPIGHGIAAGQRYTFQLTIGERGPEPGLEQIVTQQGAILRTELLIDSAGRGDRVGIAVRLVGPRVGVIPMP